MTREEAIKKLDFLKNLLPVTKDEISEIIELIETPWISVKDDLPCNHKELLEDENYTKCVLVVAVENANPTKRFIDISYMSNVFSSHNLHFYWSRKSYYTVTHWRVLPELPKE